MVDFLDDISSDRFIKVSFIGQQGVAMELQCSQADLFTFIMSLVHGSEVTKEMVKYALNSNTDDHSVKRYSSGNKFDDQEVIDFFRKLNNEAKSDNDRADIEQQIKDILNGKKDN